MKKPLLILGGIVGLGIIGFGAYYLFGRSTGNPATSTTGAAGSGSSPGGGSTGSTGVSVTPGSTTTNVSTTAPSSTNPAAANPLPTGSLVSAGTAIWNTLFPPSSASNAQSSAYSTNNNPVADVPAYDPFSDPTYNAIESADTTFVTPDTTGPSVYTGDLSGDFAANDSNGLSLDSTD